MIESRHPGRGLDSTRRHPSTDPTSLVDDPQIVRLEAELDRVRRFVGAERVEFQGGFLRQEG